jgi:hypothetical protein
MDFTFGIITGGKHNYRETKTDEEVISRIYEIINTILIQNIPNYEIIIVGGKNKYEHFDLVTHIPFDDEKGFITVKKNLITQYSKYENIVFMHDYFSLGEKWYENMLLFDEPWDIMMNRIIDINGDRFHDWVLHWDKHKCLYSKQTETFLPYNINNLTKYQYISGGYWIAKKHVMINHKLDESIGWGQGEDVRWSEKVLPMYNYKMNVNSIVKLIKPRFSNEWSLISEENLNTLLNSLKTLRPSKLGTFTTPSLNLSYKVKKTNTNGWIKE